MDNSTKAKWALRVAVAGEFFGHGVFSLQQKQGWIKYFETIGISADSAMTLMPYIGIIDIALAILVLIRPVPLALLWMSLWGFWTALLRPIAGEPVWDFIERFANWGAPLALLLMIGWPKNIKDWLKC